MFTEMITAEVPIFLIHFFIGVFALTGIIALCYLTFTTFYWLFYWIGKVGKWLYSRN
jgi:hypothetical protein